MHEIKKHALVLKDEVKAATRQLQLSKLERELKQQQEAIQKPDFWSDNRKAQELSKQHASLQSRLQPWQELRAGIKDVLEMIDLNDDQLQPELEKNLAKLEQTFYSLKKELQFSGPYDNHDAILQIHAGAGGTDAQDWAQMLERMYTRWAETHHYNIQILERSSAEEAGIKNSTLEIKGQFAYGKLKGEHGVHRLVRLSPYNADNLRQTSFAKVEILPVVDKPEDLVIDDKDLKTDVYRSGGHGGQSVNTTDSAVRVTHIPTGITVAIQNERSQLQNKETALTILRSRLAQLQLEQHKEKLEQIKGPNQSAEWGNQIRSYVLHPYKQVKDLRTKHETSDPNKVLDGDLDPFIDAYLETSLGQA